MYIKHMNHKIMTGVLLMLIISSCKKFVQISPPVTEIASATVYSTNTSAAAVMSGVYDNMEGNLSGLTNGPSSLSYLNGLLADELKNYSVTSIQLSQFYTNSLASQTNGSTNLYFWPELYKEIYVTNAVIEGVTNSSGMTPAMINQLTGEAKFMRAFLHFYATNLYGAVPLVTTTNYLTNNTISRSPQTVVYQQIIQDLKDAQADLSVNYLDASGNTTSAKVRPNQGAATAMLARVYLYTDSFANAEAQATAVINNTTNYSLYNDLDSVFLSNSAEAIWQMEPVQPGFNTFDGYEFILTSAPGTGRFHVALSTELLNAFEPGDARYSNWVGSYTKGTSTYYYPFKYKIGVDNANIPVTEYTMVLRLAEQYLIRAEARAMQGNIFGAQADINVIRSRANLSPITATDQPSLLAAILQERRVELFTEWGHRWFDLNRTASVDSVMSIVTPLKGGTWNPDWSLFPIAYSELLDNPNLTQNNGY
jgi:starch-binding outer membrane protein, SusD/RagB family